MLAKIKFNKMKTVTTFKKNKKNALKDIENGLSIVANNYFSGNNKCDKKTWDLLLRFRNKLKLHINKNFD